MSDISDRLIVIRNHLRTGAVGQREVWEEWLKAAIDEIERLQALSQNNATSWDAIVRERDELRAERDVWKVACEAQAQEVTRLKHERHTTKKMLQDILDRHAPPQSAKKM